MHILRYIGYAWCGLVVLGYAVHWLFSEHGGGIVSKSGTGDIWLIALTCAPGVGLIKLGTPKSGK